MAFPSTNIVPAQVNISMLWSLLANAVVNPITFKIVPTTSAGGKFDCTGTTGAALNCASNTTLPPSLNTIVAAAPTIVAADATGITLSVTAGALTTMLTSICTLNPTIDVTIQDGVTQLIAGKGTGQVILSP